MSNSKKLSIYTLGFLLIVVFALTFVFTWGFITHKVEDKIPQGVTVGSIDVSNKTIDIALRIVENHTSLPKQEIELYWSGGSYNLNLADLKPEIDFPKLRKELEAILPKGNYFERLAIKRRFLKYGKAISLSLKTDEDEFNKLVSKLNTEINRSPQDAAFVVDVLDKISISKERDGLQVDFNSLLGDLPEQLFLGNSRIRVPTISVKPKLTQQDLLNWEIKELVVKFYTKFDINNKNRVENIKLAASALDGTILKPGEEFSFNAWVGPRLKELGYKEAPTLVSGELTEDVGGGVCQVSSTLYNVALLAGLEIVERTHHSAPVSYVSPGRDAAVAFDYLDLRFKNIQSNHVLITASVVGNQIICRLFGTALPSKIIIQTENLTEIPFIIKSGPTPREGKNGLRVDTYVIKGNKKELVSQDYYKPLDKII